MTRFAALTHVGSRRIRSVDGMEFLKRRQEENLRATEQATRIARVANDRFAGPPRHQRIGGRDYLAWFAVAFATGCILYFAGQILRAVS